MKRGKYEEFRQELIDHKVLEWKDQRAAYDSDYRTQGVTTSLVGRAFVRYHAGKGQLQTYDIRHTRVV